MPEKHLRINLEWQTFKDSQFRYPSQFGGIGDNGEGTKEAFRYPLAQSDVLVELPKEGKVFPLETGEPARTSWNYREPHI